MKSGKYSRGQLRAMARQALSARDSGDERYFRFIMMMTMRTGLAPEIIEQRIMKLSR